MLTEPWSETTRGFRAPSGSPSIATAFVMTATTWNCVISGNSPQETIFREYHSMITSRYQKGVKEGSVLTAHITIRGGGGKPVKCGWVVDRFGVRWQITPADFDKWNTTPNKAKKEAVMAEPWKMKKLDIKRLKAAFDSA